MWISSTFRYRHSSSICSWSASLAITVFPDVVSMILGTNDSTIPQYTQQMVKFSLIRYSRISFTTILFPMWDKPHCWRSIRPENEMIQMCFPQFIALFEEWRFFDILGYLIVYHILCKLIGLPGFAVRIQHVNHVTSFNTEFSLVASNRALSLLTDTLPFFIIFPIISMMINRVILNFNKIFRMMIEQISNSQAYVDILKQVIHDTWMLISIPLFST